MPKLIRKDALLDAMRGMVYNGQNADELYEDFETLINEQQTVTENDIRDNAIDAFAEKIKYEIRNCSWQFSRLKESTIDEIARKLKEERRMGRPISEFKPMTLDELISFINSKLEEYGISQRELAEYVGVTEVSMSRWLSQKRKMPFEVASKCLKRFCYAFACYDLRNSGYVDSEG